MLKPSKHGTSPRKHLIFAAALAAVATIPGVDAVGEISAEGHAAPEATFDAWYAIRWGQVRCFAALGRSFLGGRLKKDEFFLMMNGNIDTYRYISM